MTDAGDVDLEQMKQTVFVQSREKLYYIPQRNQDICVIRSQSFTTTTYPKYFFSGNNEQGQRASIRQVALDMKLNIVMATRAEQEVQKSVGVIGKRAPCAGQIELNEALQFIKGFGYNHVADAQYIRSQCIPHMIIDTNTSYDAQRVPQIPIPSVIQAIQEFKNTYNNKYIVPAFDSSDTPSTGPNQTPSSTNDKHFVTLFDKLQSKTVHEDHNPMDITMFYVRQDSIQRFSSMVAFFKKASGVREPRTTEQGATTRKGARQRDGLRISPVSTSSYRYTTIECNSTTNDNNNRYITTELNDNTTNNTMIYDKEIYNDKEYNKTIVPYIQTSTYNNTYNNIKRKCIKRNIYNYQSQPKTITTNNAINFKKQNIRKEYIENIPQKQISFDTNSIEYNNTIVNDTYVNNKQVDNQLLPKFINTNESISWDFPLHITQLISSPTTKFITSNTSNRVPLSLNISNTVNDINKNNKSDESISNQYFKNSPKDDTNNNTNKNTNLSPSPLNINSLFCNTPTQQTEHGKFFSPTFQYLSSVESCISPCTQIQQNNNTITTTNTITTNDINDKRTSLQLKPQVFMFPDTFYANYDESIFSPKNNISQSTETCTSLSSTNNIESSNEYDMISNPTPVYPIKGSYLHSQTLQNMQLSVGDLGSGDIFLVLTPREVSGT